MRHRVISTHLDFWVEPAAAFLALCNADSPSFWLDSGIDASAGLSCLGVGAATVTTVRSGGLEEWPSGKTHDATIFDFLNRELAATLTQPRDDAPFPLGWVGWLGYELRGATLGVDVTTASRYPDAAFLFAERAVVFDHAAHRMSLVALGDAWTADLADWRDDTVRTLESLVGQGAIEVGEAPPTTPANEPVWAYSDEEYVAKIEDCQRRIRAGDAYQLCLTSEIRASVQPDPLLTYLRLRELSPTHHGGFVSVGGVSLLSSSPEQFLSISPEGHVESKPIKGTRKRGATTRQDDALLQELVTSEKERAENLMIVDLVRNDLSKVCEVGSVTVPHLLEVESYAQVHQLVSTVRGTLAADATPLDAVLACFPAGSMTGAPKISAVQILDGLEQRARGIYSGAFGYFGLDGSVDLAMVIRSIVLDEAGATIGTGGGITALSIATEELEETRIKANALLRVLGLVPL